MGGLASWNCCPMNKGELYKNLKAKELIVGDVNLAAEYFLFLNRIRCYEIIRPNELIVYLDNHLVKNEKSRYSFLLIKILTSKGIVGWVSWNLNEWEKIKVCL